MLKFTERRDFHLNQVAFKQVHRRLIYIVHVFQLAWSMNQINRASGIVMVKLYTIPMFQSGTFNDCCFYSIALFSNVLQLFRICFSLNRSHRHLINVYRRELYNAQKEVVDVNSEAACCC